MTITLKIHKISALLTLSTNPHAQPMQTPQPTTEKTPFDDGELFDLLFENFDYGLDFYLNLARQANGPILDVACGTGRVMLPGLQAGLIVDGLDFFEPMLTRDRKSVV